MTLLPAQTEIAPRRSMTAEHKAKMQAGRLKFAQQRKSIVPATRINKRHRVALSPAAEARMAQMPVSCRSEYRQAMMGKSRKAGINCQCRECFQWENVVESIRKCSCTACGLYPYRPYQDGPADSAAMKETDRG